MEKIAPGKFEVTLAGETKVVCVSFGVRSEILRIITKKQLEYRNISAKNMLPTEMRAKLAEQVEALDAERNKEEKNQARIDELQNSVNEIYEASIKIIDENKDKITEQLAVGMIDLTDDAMAEILALVLTERDSEGKVSKNVSKDSILRSEKYAEDSDELLSLIEGIMIYLTDALKKIQTISQMLSSLVRQD
jgi:DNA repair ATPase RecN